MPSRELTRSLTPQLAAALCDAVNRRLSVELQVDQSTLNNRLLNLRKRGEANGGLPRTGCDN